VKRRIKRNPQKRCTFEKRPIKETCTLVQEKHTTEGPEKRYTYGKRPIKEIYI